MQGLTVAEPRFPGDDGTADPAVRAALTAYAAGQGSECAALTALARSRLLVPVVAAAGEADENGSEKSTEMALPTLVGRDGRRAVLAFTGLDALKQWRSDARPVPVPAASAWLAGTQDGASAVLIDVAGPVTLAVDGARLAALAAGRPVPLPHQDPEVLAALRTALAHEPLIVAAALTSPDQRVTATGDADLDHAGLDLDLDGPAQDPDGPPQDPDGPAAREGADGASPGADLALQVTLAPGCDPGAAGAAVRRAADALLAATGDRLRRGVEVSVAQGGRTAGSR
ncbi:MAG TPA: SseB family protein [Streptosporangiaceae bacterium]|nr:SseB family protein [Streptosporangiaceae bacterium]